jgi:hypothetical protein
MGAKGNHVAPAAYVENVPPPSTARQKPVVGHDTEVSGENPEVLRVTPESQSVP